MSEETTEVAEAPEITQEAPQEQAQPEPQEQRTVEQDEGASQEGESPQENALEKSEEKAPPEAPKSIRIGNEDVPVERIQKTWEQAKQVVAKHAELTKLEAAFNQTLESFRKDPLSILLRDYTALAGKERAEEAIDKLCEKWVVDRYNLSQLPEGERKARDLASQLAEMQQKLKAREEAEATQRQEAMKGQIMEGLFKAVTPLYQELGLEQYELTDKEGVFIEDPLQMIFSRLRRDIDPGAPVTPEMLRKAAEAVKDSLERREQARLGKLSYEQLKGRPDLIERQRKEDLAQVRASRGRAKAAPPNPVQEDVRRNGRTAIPTSRW